jgi:hypothetical protein
MAGSPLSRSRSPAVAAIWSAFEQSGAAALDVRSELPSDGIASMRHRYPRFEAWVTPTPSVDCVI